MDRIQALNAFVLVAEEGGFSRAAAELGISKSAASRQIAALEEALGAPLLSRTTRTVELTEAGRTYLDQVKAILAELAAADRAVTAPRDDLEGHLWVAAPIAFGASRLGAIAAAFMAHHPRLVADIVLTDRYVEPGEEGFDLSLGFEPAGSETGALRLLPVETGLFASSDYIARHGRPQAPADLSRHPALCLGTRRRQIAWHLRGQVEPIQASPRLVSNQAQVIREGAL
ncbi:MAG: LysR family transcriptional regulator, partial [Rhizobiales bacterium]|nr:LysR family transcriptional regulator [Hyphomicrobiales bacterium]